MTMRADVVSLVEKLEARFINLHPTIQQLFFKLESMDKGEHKDFLLKTLLLKFDDIAREGRKIFAHYNMLGCSLNIKHTLKTFGTKRMKYEGKTECEEELKIPIPFKLIAMHEALEKNFDWVVPENPFDERSRPKGSERGNSEPCISKIQCICEKLSNVSLDDSIDKT